MFLELKGIKNQEHLEQSIRGEYLWTSAFIIATRLDPIAKENILTLMLSNAGDVFLLVVKEIHFSSKIS